MYQFRYTVSQVFSGMWVVEVEANSVLYCYIYIPTEVFFSLLFARFRQNWYQWGRFKCEIQTGLNLPEGLFPNGSSV